MIFQNIECQWDIRNEIKTKKIDGNKFKWANAFSSAYKTTCNKTFRASTHVKIHLLLLIVQPANPLHIKKCTYALKDIDRENNASVYVFVYIIIMSLVCD